MRVKNELRKQQKAITVDLKSRAQKAEKILGEIEACEQNLATLNESLSAVLGIGGETATVTKAPKVKVAKTAKTKPLSKRKGGRSASQMPCIRDFLVQAGKPMRLAEIVQGMQKAGHVFTAKNPLKATEKLLYANKKVFKKAGRGLFKAG